jgi:hypothetical protein
MNSELVMRKWNCKGNGKWKEGDWGLERENRETKRNLEGQSNKYH